MVNVSVAQSPMEPPLAVPYPVPASAVPVMGAAISKVLGKKYNEAKTVFPCTWIYYEDDWFISSDKKGHCFILKFNDIDKTKQQYRV